MPARAFAPLTLFLALPFLAPSLVAQSQQPHSLDWVLARHFEARGGLGRIKALPGLLSTGHIDLGGMRLALRVENPRGAFRSDTTLNGLTKTEAFDGLHGWVADPFMGAPAPAPMAPAQLRQARLQADFDGPLVDWKAKGHHAALSGMALVDGAPAYAVKVRMEDGGTLTSFIDARTFMEVKAVNEAVSDGKTVEVETKLSDYRAVDGVLLPFRLEVAPKGRPEGMVIQFDTVAAEADFDPAHFRMPSH